MKNIVFIFSLIVISMTVCAQSTWNSLGPAYNKPNFMGSGLVNSVEFHPSDPNSIYIGTYGGIWHTADGGESWNEFAVTKEFEHTVTVSDIVVNNSNPTILYASTGSKETSRLPFFYAIEHPTSGVYKCVINGATKTWTKISNGLPNMDVAYGIDKLNVGYFIHTLEQDPFDPNILYAGTSGGLYRTMNVQSASPTWHKLTSIPSVPVLTLTFTGTSVLDRVIYVSGKNFIYKSVDNSNWIEIAGSCGTCLNYNTQPEIQSEISSLISTVQQGLNVTSTTQYAQYYVEKSIKYPGQIYASAIVYIVTRYMDANNNEQQFGKNYKYVVKYDGTNWDTSTGHILKLVEVAPYTPVPGQPMPPASTRVSGYNPHLSVAYNPFVSPNESIYAAYEGIEGYVENTSSISGYSYFSTGYPYASTGGNAHPDFHDLKYNPLNNYLYGGNDGFLAKYTPVTTFVSPSIANNLVPLANAGLNCARIWHLSVSLIDPSKIAIGKQDNGSMVLENNIWSTILFGDGIGQLFHGSAYSYCYQGGCYVKNGNTSPQIYKTYKCDNNGNCSWQSVGHDWYYKAFYADPVDTNTVYLPMAWGLYKSVNKNPNVSLVTDFSTIPDGSWNTISALGIAPFNNNKVYVALSSPTGRNQGLHLYRTGNATQPNPTWTKLPNPPLVSANERCRGIVLSSLNDYTVFMCLTNNSDVNRARIFKNNSTNGTVVWNDYNQSALIPNEYQIHCILYEKGSNDGLYAGTDNGIYYTNRNMNSWVRYDAGLPNVAVTGMEYNTKSNKITISTWGRGVWDIYPYCVAAGNISINNSNYNYYVNTPTNANGVIQYTYTMPNDPMTMLSRFELKATDMVAFLPGASFTTSQSSITSLEAYIQPCNQGHSYKLGEYYVDSSPSESDNSSIQEEAITEDVLTVFPNPNHGEVNLSFKIQEGEYAIVLIYDLEGKEVYSSKLKGLDNEVYKINLFDQPDGMYILKVIKNGKDVYSSKLLLSKLGNTETPVVNDQKNNSIKINTKKRKK